MPNGGVDLWFNNFKSYLEHLSEGDPMYVKPPYDEFPISNVVCINADVKILKALVGNILVDISANKGGGVGALCFLEEVDQIIGMILW